MKPKIVLTNIFAALIFLGCHSGSKLTQTSEQPQINKNTLPKTVYYIDSNDDGIFELADIDEENKPEPIQGKSQFYRDFYSKLNYPASARENGIEGIVLLEVDIDSKGKVVGVGIKNGISTECDNAAKVAYINATQQGYWPLIINNIPSKYKMNFAVGFWLN